VLDRLGPDAKLIAIDTNPDFVAYLRREIADPRLHCVAGSAADVRTILGEHGHDHADYILSGLPFSTLPPGVGPQIAEQTAAALRPGGAFLVYQFSPKVHDFLAPHFSRIDRGFEPINIRRRNFLGLSRRRLSVIFSGTASGADRGSASRPEISHGPATRRRTRSRAPRGPGA
jgi:SAM-dependent methyltransferase